MESALGGGFIINALKDLLKTPGGEDSDSDSDSKVSTPSSSTCVVNHK
jgi:hypothetical protein